MNDKERAMRTAFRHAVLAEPASGTEFADLLIMDEAEDAYVADGHTNDDVECLKAEVLEEMKAEAADLARRCSEDEARRRGAIEDLPALASQLRGALGLDNPALRYLAALVSELAYAHISRHEIDAMRGRAVLLPCAAHRQAVKRRIEVTPEHIFPGVPGIERHFVVETDTVVAAGLDLGGLLFIGFRGTAGLYDIVNNCRMWRRSIARILGRRTLHDAGSVHSWFASETVRILIPVQHELCRLGIAATTPTVFAGHSLGGAIAALASGFSGIAKPMVCTFGAPRYADQRAHNAMLNGDAWHASRPGDLVPVVPPRAFGYANAACLRRPDDSEVPVATRDSLLRILPQWPGFAWSRGRAHWIFEYRRDVGIAAKAPGACQPLLPETSGTRIIRGPDPEDLDVRGRDLAGRARPDPVPSSPRLRVLLLCDVDASEQVDFSLPRMFTLLTRDHAGPMRVLRSELATYIREEAGSRQILILTDYTGAESLAQLATHRRQLEEQPAVWWVLADHRPASHHENPPRP